MLSPVTSRVVRQPISCTRPWARFSMRTQSPMRNGASIPSGDPRQRVGHHVADREAQHRQHQARAGRDPRQVVAEQQRQFRPAPASANRNTRSRSSSTLGTGLRPLRRCDAAPTRARAADARR